MIRVDFKIITLDQEIGTIDDVVTEPPRSLWFWKWYAEQLLNGLTTKQGDFSESMWFFISG